MRTTDTPTPAPSPKQFTAWLRERPRAAWIQVGDPHPTERAALEALMAHAKRLGLRSSDMTVLEAGRTPRR